MQTHTSTHMDTNNINHMHTHSHVHVHWLWCIEKRGPCFPRENGKNEQLGKGWEEEKSKTEGKKKKIDNTLKNGLVDMRRAQIVPDLPSVDPATMRFR